MIKPQREPPELFSSERPVRSDFARRGGLSYKVRRRLTLMMSVPLFNLINATPLNPVPMFGTAQSTT